MNLDSGANMPGREVVGELSLKSVYEIAKAKHIDQPMLQLESVAKNVAATARSMGIAVESRKPNLEGVDGDV